MSISYLHPTSITEFEKTYHKEYRQELESCDNWIKWCNENNDTHGINFHQGLRAGHVYNNIKMEQLLRVLKQEEPNRNQKMSEMEDLLRSVRMIAQRQGEGTKWDRLDASIAKIGIGSITARSYKILPSDNEPTV